MAKTITMTAEERLLENILDIEFKCIGGVIPPEKAKEKQLAFINQFKEDICREQIPTELEIDKKRKIKWDEYRHPEAWDVYSEGFMDAINWIKNRLSDQLKNK